MYIMTLSDLFRFVFLIRCKELRIKRDQKLNIRYLELEPDLNKIKLCIDSCSNEKQLESTYSMIETFDLKHKYFKWTKELKRIYKEKTQKYHSN